MSDQHTGWSADGNWFWDGTQWNDAISPDGQWRFDGASWNLYQGQRTQMPPAPLSEPVPPPAQAAPFLQAIDPKDTMPSWVAESEIERIQQQQVEQLVSSVAPPAPPLPPELDWRRVGEFMEYHEGQHAYSSWQIGPLSVIIYIVLLWFCTPVSAVFVWFTGWGTTSKVITTLLSVGLMVFALIYYASRAAAS